MSATGGAGIGKATAELLQEMQRAQQAMEQAEQLNKTGGAQFNQTLAAQQGQVDQVNQVGQVGQVQATPEAHNILMSAKAAMVDPSLGVQRVEGAQNATMKKMVSELVDGQNKMEKIMELALSGRQFNNQEMLIMQAGIFRYSQEIELTGKVIDKATQGIKQTMNTQV